MIEISAGIDMTALTLGALALAVLLETLAPLRPAEQLTRRWLHNGALAVVTYTTSYFLITAVALWVVHWSSELPGLSLALSAALPLWVQCVIVFFTVECCRYGIHWLSHTVPLFWRLHAIHHADPEVDAATAFRHHPFEGLIGVIPVTLLTVVLGAAPAALIFYRAIDLAMTVWTHTNIRLPKNVEKALGGVIVTPRFHRTHHYAERQYTDSNYGSITPWFDFLFGTYRSVSDQQDAEAPLGLGWDPVVASRLDHLLLAPATNAPLQQGASNEAR